MSYFSLARQRLLTRFRFPLDPSPSPSLLSPPPPSAALRRPHAPPLAVRAPPSARLPPSHPHILHAAAVTRRPRARAPPLTCARAPSRRRRLPPRAQPRTCTTSTASAPSHRHPRARAPPLSRLRPSAAHALCHHHCRFPRCATHASPRRPLATASSRPCYSLCRDGS
jgi:hypothetical protein